MNEGIAIRTRASAGSQVRKGGLPPLLIRSTQVSESGAKPPFLTCDPALCSFCLNLASDR
jgi:hypothetical protein